MMGDEKTDLVLGAKYRVVKGDCMVVGILTQIELGKPYGTDVVTRFTSSYLELTEESEWWGDPRTAKIYGPWDLIEPVAD